MYAWTNVTPARSAEPSPLLIHLAGEFADRIALLWPAPHAAFLAAGANQRHLIAIGLSHGSVETDLRGVLVMPFKHALRAVLPNAPRGLPRALGRLGEMLWSPSDYGLLLAVLLRPEPAKVLAHATELTPTLVQRLHRLPTPLVTASLSPFALTADQSALVAEAFSAIEFRDGPAAGRRVAERWARAGSLTALLERIREDLGPELPEPPFPGTDRLRPLATKAAVHEAASRYNNCLRDQLYRAYDGTSAFYEWTGGPRAAVEIMRDDLYGWRLQEARLRNNATLAEADRLALADDLRAMGVRTGRTLWQLENATWRAGDPDFRFMTHDQAVASLFE